MEGNQPNAARSIKRNDAPQADTDRRLLEMLEEGPEPIWQRQEWEFDSQQLQVRPAGGRPPPIAAPRTNVGGNQPTSHMVAAVAGKFGVETATRNIISVAQPAIAGQNVVPLPGDAVLCADDELPALQKQEMQGKCHVASCSRPLHELREFHQRFQICDEHIKAPRVIRGGRVERFCQQCSRFHAVTEFDGDRRSCRTQLERHNARRRKQRALAAGASTPASSSSTAAAAAAASASIAEELQGQPPLQRQRVGSHKAWNANTGGGSGVGATAAVSSAMPVGLPNDISKELPGALQAAAGGTSSSAAMRSEHALVNHAAIGAASAAGCGAVDPGWPFTSICVGGDLNMGAHGGVADNMHVNLGSGSFPVDPMWPWGGPAGSSTPLVPSVDWEAPMHAVHKVVVPATNHMQVQADSLAAGEQDTFVDPAAGMHDKQAWINAPDDDFWRVMYDFTHSQTPRSCGGSAGTAQDTTTHASKSLSSQQGGFGGAGVAVDTTGSQHMPMPSSQAIGGERATVDAKSEGGLDACCATMRNVSAAARANASMEVHASARSARQVSPHDAATWAAGERPGRSEKASRVAEDVGACLQHNAAVGQASETMPGSEEEQMRGASQAQFFRLGPVQQEIDEDTDRLLQQIFTKPKVARALRRVLLGTPPIDRAQGGLGTLTTGGSPKGGLSPAGEGPERAYQRAVIAAAMLQLRGAEVPPGARACLRICAKLWSCTPDTLPANLQDSVLSWACKPEVWGCIRPGCVFLTLDLTVRYDERQAALARGALSLMQHLLKWCSCWREQSVLLQIEDSLAMRKPGEEPVALDPLTSRLWAETPSVNSVDCRVLLTDCETPLRLRVNGHNLPARHHPPSAAHGCVCRGARPRDRVAHTSTKAPATVGGSTGPSPDTCAMQVASKGCSGDQEPADEKFAIKKAPLQVAANLAGENGGDNGSSLPSNSAGLMFASSPPCAPVDTNSHSEEFQNGNADGSQQRTAGDLIVRCQGDDQMSLRSFWKEGMPPGTVDVEVRPPQLPPGGSAILWVEAWSGIFMSTAVPVLVTTDVELACTVQGLLEGFNKAEASKEKAAEHCKACVEGLMLSLCSA